MSRPLALDLFCCAGGASMGLYRAGFDVIGVDIKCQPRYPFRFVQADALNPPFDLRAFDFVWASPPCQAWTNGANARARKGAIYPRLIQQTRVLLGDLPFTCLENVMKAPVRPDLVLHGHMFPELRVIRRRKFELSFGGLNLVPALPKGLLRQGYACVVGNGTPSGVRAMGLPNSSAAERRAAMGIDWMTGPELAQAIPPAYAEYIGRAALAHIGAERLAA